MVKIWAEGSVGDALRCLASEERYVACDDLNFPVSSHIYYFHLSVMWRFIIWMLVEAWPLCTFSSKNISCSFDLNCFGNKDMRRSGMQSAYGNMKNSQRWEISRRSNWGDMWDGYMVFLSFSTRLQWLPEAVFSVKLHQLHLSMFLLSRFGIHSDTIKKK